MKKKILGILGVLIVGLFVFGCVESQNVDVVDDKGNFVGQASRISTGKYKYTAPIKAVSTVACKDSDGGNQPNYKGIVSLLEGGVVVATVADTCSGGLNVLEFFCSGDVSGNLFDYKLANCKFGCSDGACQVG